MSRAVFPPCCLAHGQTMIGIMVASFKRTDAATVVFCARIPMEGHCWLMPPVETPGHSQDSLAQFLVQSLLLSHFSWCTQCFVCALQESVSPVLWKFCNQIPLAFKVEFPGGSQFLCQIPRLGNLLWALELLQQCENSFGIIFLQFMSCLLSASVAGLTCRASQVCCSQSPCPLTGHFWPVPLQETLRHSKAGLA